jgi:hypothetical protein
MKISKQFVFLFFAISACYVGNFSTAQASVIGDVITIERLYPDLNTHYQPSVSTTVSLGTSDQTNPFGYELVNPEANNISIQWINSSSYGGTSTVFDGYRFTGFGNLIQNVTASDVTNITITELNYGADFITLNLGSPFNSSSSLNLQIQFAPVPLPAALPLFSSAIIGMLAFAKRRKCRY